MEVTSKDLVAQILGVPAVHWHEEVERFYGYVSKAILRAMIKRVGGREAERGEGCDVITHLGKWEFCTSRNGKNSHGDKADRSRCPGKCVQVFGRPHPGWISGREFLTLHGVDGNELTAIVREVIDECSAFARQTRLPL